MGAAGDHVMPPGHGRRLAELISQARLAEIDDSYTLFPLNQPATLAQLITEFTHAPSTPRPLWLGAGAVSDDERTDHPYMLEGQ